MPLHPTRIDLPGEAREKLVSLLNARLADAVVLSTHAKQAHWNVRGPAFIALHELFDSVADKAREYADEIAERLAALGGIALGSAEKASDATILENYPPDISEGPAHVDALARSIAAFSNAVRQDIARAGELKDEVTADILTGIARGMDQMLWFVEAHQQADR